MVKKIKVIVCVSPDEDCVITILKSSHKNLFIVIWEDPYFEAECKNMTVEEILKVSWGKVTKDDLQSLAE